MLLSISKCEHLTIKRNSAYKLNDQILHQVTNKNVLRRVTINQTCHGMILSQTSKHHNFNLCILPKESKKCSPNIKSLACNTCVTLIVEYTSVVWSAHNKISRIEMVHCKAVRSSSYFMLTKLSWESLE